VTKRKGYYPRQNNKRPAPAGSEEAMVRPNLATINLEAIGGRAGLSVGDRVRINAPGLYSGEIGVVERLSNGVIPSALVVTDSGGRRQVRTIDLVAASPARSEQSAAN
jgi:hypothetical protein